MSVGVVSVRAQTPEPYTGRTEVIIDCDDCAARGRACTDCVVNVLLGTPETLLDDERAALDALAEAGLAPGLRLVPLHQPGATGAASAVS